LTFSGVGFFGVAGDGDFEVRSGPKLLSLRERIAQIAP
jgi:hypothetical protein